MPERRFGSVGHPTTGLLLGQQIGNARIAITIEFYCKRCDLRLVDGRLGPTRADAIHCDAPAFLSPEAASSNAATR